MSTSKIIAGSLITVVIASAAIFAIISGGRMKPMASMPNSSTAIAASSVSITNYMFGPSAIKVARGTTVTWTNHDAVSHTITADSPSANAPSSMDIAQGQSYSFQFKVAGTYTYHCFPHPYMHGTVIVTN